MVPNGWRNSTLGQIASFKNGLNFNKADNGERIKIVGVGDFKGLTELKSTDSLEYVQVDNKVTEDELLKSGDLLFVRSNGNKELIGRCLYFPKVNERMSYSGFTIRARVNTDKMLPEYASNLVRSSIVTRQIFQYGGGTNISNLSQQILNDLAFLIPPLSEQKKIAQILTTWDKSIATTERLLENSQKQKQALMQQLLTGKKRLHGFSDNWKHPKLKVLIEEGKLRNQNLAVDRVLSVTNHSGFVLPEDQFSKRVASDDVSNYKIVKRGQYGYNPSRLNVGSFARLDDYEIGILSPMYVVFSIDEDKLNSDFFYNWMQSNEAKQRIKNSTQGSVRDSVGFDALSSFLIKLPSLAEQEKIAFVLNAADKEIQTIQTKLEFLKKEKKALMQQLLTGKRRVKVEH